jgi:hypothetical protein
MALFWFFAGMLTMLSLLMALAQWLRRMPRLATLPEVPWPASVSAVVLVVGMIGVGLWREHSGADDTLLAAASRSPAVPGGTAAEPTAPAAASSFDASTFDASSAAASSAAASSAAASSAAASSFGASSFDASPAAAASAAGSFGMAAKIFGDATAPTTTAPAVNSAGAAGAPHMPGAKAGAGSMESAIAALEARLAKGGGSADDWELLAKSFEFLGRPADAAKARARQLPVLTRDTTADVGALADVNAGAAGPAVAAGLAVSGEVTLAKNLIGKARVGETLFIVAKSVASPGIPVAVFRGSVGSWPLKFTLDDSRSMMPGRTLSSAGRVTIEARISRKGQPLPAAGDLQGSSGIIDPADHQALKILIDRVIT